MPPPNVIVFFTDQQRWDTMGLHGNPLELTPNLDRVAQAGTHVAYSFTCQPVCGPARSCLQTGLYATQTGCYQNGIPLPLHLKTLAHHFNDAGYQTGYIGKWHLAGGHATEAVPEAERGGYRYWLGANGLEMVSDAYHCLMYDNDDNPVLLPGYRVDAAGLPVPEEMMGRSILPLLRGERQGWPEEAFVQISEAELGRAVRTRRWKYSVTCAESINRPYAESYTESYLYDMEFDPYELRNLIGLDSHRRVADVMKARLLRRMAEVGEPTPTIVDAPSRPGGQRRVTELETLA